MYQAAPNDNRKQTPRALSSKVFSRAETPAAETVTLNPSHVIINNSGSYAFLYEITGSIGGTIDKQGGYITGSYVNRPAAVGGAPIRLDINPRAWRRTDGASAVGDVTFVYRGQ